MESIWNVCVRMMTYTQQVLRIIFLVHSDLRDPNYSLIGDTVGLYAMGDVCTYLMWTTLCRTCN